jgi:hypothetical protein
MRTLSYSAKCCADVRNPRCCRQCTGRHPDSRIASDRRRTYGRRSHSPASDFRLLGDLESIIDFDAEVPYRRFQLGVSEEQLHGAEVLGAPIDQRRLRPAHGVRAIVGAVQSQVLNPVLEDPCVLPGSEMRRIVEPAGEEEGFRLQPGKPNPRLQSVPGSWRDLELHGALGLVLHDSGARRNLVSMTDVSDLEGDEIASAKLAVDPS